MNGAARTRRNGIALLAAALWTAGTAGLGGQTIRGTVTDVEAGSPVALAYVALLAEGETLVAAVLSEADGAFSVRAPTPGSYFLYVTRRGYRPVMDGLFELGADGVIDLQVGLTPAPLRLEPLDVEVRGRSPDLHSVGFYRRREMGLGRFIEREQIERTAVAFLTDALQGLPRLVVVPQRPAPGLPTGLLNPEVRIRSPTGSCSPTLYVDGQVVTFGSRRGRGEAIRPDDHVDPSGVEAVEVYAGAEVPLDFQATGGCGVILVWTRVRDLDV